MDVIVSLLPGQQKVWNMADRLGRNVGQITQTDEDRFVIAPKFDTPLSKVETIQPTLSAAMDEVAKRLRGVCQLSSNTDQ